MNAYPKDKINSNDKKTVSEWNQGEGLYLFSVSSPFVLGEEARASLMLSLKSTMEIQQWPLMTWL